VLEQFSCHVGCIPRALISEANGEDNLSSPGCLGKQPAEDKFQWAQSSPRATSDK